MHFAGFSFTRFKETKRFGDRHLIDKNLIFAQFLFRDAVAGLNDRCLGGFFSRRNICCLGKKLTDGNRVGGVISPLVDDLKGIIRANNGGGYLHATRTPAIGHRHFTTGKRDLISRNCNGLKQCAPDHAFGLFIEIGEIIGRCPIRRIIDSLFHGVTPRLRVGIERSQYQAWPVVLRLRPACGEQVQARPGNRHSAEA